MFRDSLSVMQRQYRMFFIVKSLVFLTLLVAPWAARAAEADLYCLTGTSSTGAPIFQPASGANPCPTSVMGGQTGTPSGYNVAIGATATQVIPAGAFTLFYELQVQGTAGVCMSYVTGTITISGQTCTGAGAFYLAPLGWYKTPFPFVANTALYAVAASVSTSTVSVGGH